jgi:hypothetical protein
MLATFGAGLFERNVQDGLRRLQRAAEARHRDHTGEEGNGAPI